jgi:hypothetical protein
MENHGRFSCHPAVLHGGSRAILLTQLEADEGQSLILHHGSLYSPFTGARYFNHPVKVWRQYICLNEPITALSYRLPFDDLDDVDGFACSNSREVVRRL